jgi:hypothetical protein
MAIFIQRDKEFLFTLLRLFDQREFQVFRQFLCDRVEYLKEKLTEGDDIEKRIEIKTLRWILNTLPEELKRRTQDED